jgi:hypothetical protein
MLDIDGAPAEPADAELAQRVAEPAELESEPTPNADHVF